jgi:DNA-binding LacI/PurR family transcriptional regulator
MSTPGPGEVNMADVARAAGVTIGTVSRALRGLPGVSERNRERIRAIADELSYVVSPEASRLARGPRGRVAVVVPKIDAWFYSTMLAHIERVLATAEIDVLIYQVHGEEQRTRFFRDLPSRRKVDAVVMIALPLQRSEVDRLDLLGVDVIVAGGRVRVYPHVEVDDYAIGRAAVGHLLELGHRRIAMIRTKEAIAAWSPDLQRTRAYGDALKEAGIPLRDDYVVTRAYGTEGGADAVEHLLALDERPTAIFAYSDEIAVGALERLRERSVDVPGEISVVGVDDHPLAAVFGLTTVGQDLAAQGRLAGEMALTLLRGEPLEDDAIVVPSTLLARATTAPPSLP